MKKAIFSVITGDYDRITPAPNFPDWDCIMYIDREVDDPKGWTIRQLDKSSDPLIQSRFIKIRSHIHLSEYDLVCYIDGNQYFLKEPPSYPIWFSHTRRENIFQEADQIIKNGRFDKNAIQPQINYYQEKGYEDQGLYLNGFFVREHNERINKLHDVWFRETTRYVPRDQLSLPFAIFITGIEPENIKPASLKEKFAVVKYAHQQKYERTSHLPG